MLKTEVTADSIHIEVDLPVSPHDAWALVTQQRHITAWWGDHVYFQEGPGGELVERWFDGRRTVTTWGRITRYEPPEAIEMTWADDDWRSHTKVVIGMSGRGRGTRLTLDHSGWSVRPAGERQASIEAHAAGWARHLTRLADYAAQRRAR